MFSDSREKRLGAYRSLDGKDHGGPSLTAQYRQLTVFCCDIVGSSHLAARLEPEELHELIGRSLRSFTVEIDALGGYLVRYAGDGLLAFFGYPAARENDAERALRAAIRLNEAARSVFTSDRRPLKIRTGIATGPVIVGDLIGQGAATEPLVTGPAANLAARLQARARPGQIVIADSTRRLTSKLFALEELKLLRVKGFAGAVRAWRVLSTSTDARRGAAQEVAPSTATMVGRDVELQMLIQAWRDIQDGGVRRVDIVGPPGVGKTRLVREFQRALSIQPRSWIAVEAAEIFQPISYYLVKQVLYAAIEDLQKRDIIARRALLRRHVAVFGPRDCRDIRYAAFQLGLVQSHRRHERRGATHEADLSPLLTRLVEEMSRRSPLVILAEDIHWIDESSRDLLESIGSAAGGAKILILTTSRTRPFGESHGEDARRYLAMAPLSASDCATLVEAIVSDQMPRRRIREICARSEGNPLFARELCVLALDLPPEDTLAGLPHTLADLLLARLDATGEAQAYARAAAVLGQTFRRDDLAGLLGLSGEAVEAALDRLVDAGVVDRQPDGSRFAFRHWLYQQTAHSTLLRSQKMALHRRAAESLLARGGAGEPAEPAVLAAHWSAAEMWEKAVEAWCEAARRASASRSYSEAEISYRRALGILEDHPSISLPRAELLRIRSALAGVLQITHGYSSPATLEASARVSAMANGTGDARRRRNESAAAWMAASSAGRYREAAAIATRLLALARAEDGAEGLAIAYMAGLTARYRTGDFRGSERMFIAGLPYFAHEAFTRRPGAVAQAFGNAAFNALILGLNREADERIEHCIAVANENGGPYDMSFALHMKSACLILAGRHDMAIAPAQRAVELAEENDFAQLGAISGVLTGAAIAEIGPTREGLSLMLDGLARMERDNVRVGRTMYLTWVAKAQMTLGHWGAALSAAADALSVNPEEKFYRTEALRLRALANHALGERELGLRELEIAAKWAGRRGALLFRGEAEKSIKTVSM